jgi:Sulfotransferase domain
MKVFDRVQHGTVKPNFFIVGAPRCGTTSLTHWLALHPDVYIPEIKVPFHFGSDLDMIPKRKFRDRNSYISLFEAGAMRPRVGESTPFYLYSKRAAREIKDFDPAARIIIMLRNPVDMMYSMHARNLMDGNETLKDFSAALEAEQVRRKGSYLPKTCFFRQGLYYRDLAQFPEQLGRYRELFGHEQLHVIIFDDLRAAPEKTLSLVLSFLGLEGASQTPLDSANRSIGVRSPRLAGFLRAPPAALLRLPGGLGQSLVWRLNRWNREEVGRPPIDPTLRGQLLQEFAADIHELGNVLRRDLSKWLR